MVTTLKPPDIHDRSARQHHPYEYANLGGTPCCGATGGSDLLTGMIDANGKATYYHYDELNRQIQTVRKSGGTNDTVTPADAVTTTTYDPDNNRIAVTDANGNTTAYTFDALDRQSGMTNAAGDVSTTAYDPVGNVLQTTDPRGDVTTTVYDPLNRPVQRDRQPGTGINDRLRSRRQRHFHHRCQRQHHQHDLRRPQPAHQHDRPARAPDDDDV